MVEFPILEFDPTREAFIEPSRTIEAVDVAEACVLCFFSEAIAAFVEANQPYIVAHIRSEGMEYPVYDFLHNGKRLALVQAGVGAPIGAGQIEELTAMGCRKFIVCGSCGALKSELVAGHLVIPNAAVRDEGTSYHYAAPARVIHADGEAVACLEALLEERGVPYVTGMTWTTDAFYRETPNRIAARKAEGCITVDMEASAYMAVAQFRGVTLGQVLYAGDTLAGEEWDRRRYSTRFEVRAALLELALEAAGRL